MTIKRRLLERANDLMKVGELSLARECQIFVRDACYYRAWMMQLLLCSHEYNKLKGAVLILMAERELNERLKQGSEGAIEVS